MQDPAAEAGCLKPSGARIYDYYLGGTGNFAADREAADRISALTPGMRSLVRQHREFARRATAWLAGQGIRQFLDVGCGIPLAPSVGDVAREVQPGARAAYVADPDSLAYARTLLAGEGSAVIGGDAGDPGRVLAAPGLLEVIDLREPCAVVLAGILGIMDAGIARGVVAGYAERLVAGSAIAVSCVSYADQQAGDEAAAAYKAATGGAWHSHSPETVESFFGGLTLARRGVGDVRRWRPIVPGAGGRDVTVIGGVGLKGWRRTHSAPHGGEYVSSIKQEDSSLVLPAQTYRNW